MQAFCLCNILIVSVLMRCVNVFVKLNPLKLPKNPVFLHGFRLNILLLCIKENQYAEFVSASGQGDSETSSE